MTVTTEKTTAERLLEAFMGFRRITGRPNQVMSGLTPGEARQIARERLVAAARGDDPSSDRKAARRLLTVGEVCDLYMEAALAGQVPGVE